MDSTGSSPRISFESATIHKHHTAKDTSDVSEGKKSRREIKAQRKTLDSFLSGEKKPNNQSPLFSKGADIDVNLILSGGGGGGSSSTAGGGTGMDIALETEVKQKPKRTQRHTLGSTPLKQYVEESHIDPNFLPDISSNFKKQHQEKPKTPAITTPFQLLDLAVNEVDEASSSPNIRRQQSDMVSPMGTTVGGGPFLPEAASMLDRKNRTDSFMTYSSIKSSVSGLIPKALLTQFPESSKSASAAVSSTKKQTTSTSSILLRIRMGGAIIAGPLAKDAIEGISYSYLAPSLTIYISSSIEHIHLISFLLKRAWLLSFFSSHLIIIIITSVSHLPFLTLGMGLQQKELKILKDAFDKIDDEKDSCISSVKLFAALEKMGYKENHFVVKVYQLIDLEGTSIFTILHR